MVALDCHRYFVMRNRAADRDVATKGNSVWKTRPTMADLGMGTVNAGPIKPGLTRAKPPRSLEKING
tara:strand:+ start:230 stop:430 length:201 start_codon:yes stop_codon:yes gene_type:complete